MPGAAVRGKTSSAADVSCFLDGGVIGLRRGARRVLHARARIMGACMGLRRTQGESKVASQMSFV